MKKVLFIAAALLILAGSLNAAPPKGYIGIYADANHSVCNYMGTGAMTFYVWCLPSQNGLTAAEFAVSVPAWVFASPTLNPAAIALGSLTGGTSVTFPTCQNDWVWTHSVSAFVTAPTPGSISLIPDPTATPPLLGFASCALGNPIEDIRVLNNLVLNGPCLVAAKDASWGAIKSLF
jgi:hypothetical protein